MYRILGVCITFFGVILIDLLFDGKRFNWRSTLESATLLAMLAIAIDLVL